MKKIFPATLLLLSYLSPAQCPVVTCPTSATFACNSPVTVTATSNYSANIVSKWFAPGNMPIVSAGTATSVVSLAHMGTYTVQFRDTGSNCVTSSTIDIIAPAPVSPLGVSTPSFLLPASTFSQSCPNSTLGFAIWASTFPMAGGPVTFTAGPAGGAPPAPGMLSTVNSYTIATCGGYYFMVRDVASGCSSAYTLDIGCPANPLPLVAVNPGGTVCAGSSTVLVANGANSYTWSTGSTGASVSVLPAASTVYTVAGTGNGGCIATATAAVGVNTTCSQVWPGDASSDGIVDNSDIFELGFAFSSSGPARTAASNNFISQYAGNWTGTVSTGKNKCHADCNGDGLVNFSDTIAIYNNFNMTHAFRAGLTTATNMISLSSGAASLTAGDWAKLDVVAGSSSTPFPQLYGLGFDIYFDAAMIEGNSAYLVYTPSFLDNGNQNIILRKPDFAKGRIHCASVRTSGGDVTGWGKIAEFHFRLKGNVPAGSNFSASLANAVTVTRSGQKSQASVNNLALPVNNDPNSITEQKLKSSCWFYPQPAGDLLELRSGLEEQVRFRISDLSGRQLMSGEFISQSAVDISSLAPGTYFISMNAGSASSARKLLILR